MMIRLAICFLVMVGGCGNGSPSRPDGGRPLDGGRPPDDAAAPRTARFIMMGDQGTGDPRQFAVADAIGQLCAREGCDFVVLLGDNLYEDGADSVSDPVWQEKFEIPYAAIDRPFYAILGNHDYGPSGHDIERSDHEIEYTAHSAKWRMPSEYYTLTRGPVGFIMLDTTSILLENLVDGDQRAWWPSALAQARRSPWVIAAGHHPFLANGHNGSAEHYSAPLHDFLANLVCGQVDLYVAGHDHVREWLDAPTRCPGTELLVSGAGGNVDPFERDEVPVHWHDDTRAGFVYVVAEETRLTTRFVDIDGQTDFERILTR